MDRIKTDASGPPSQPCNPAFHPRPTKLLVRRTETTHLISKWQVGDTSTLRCVRCRLKRKNKNCASRAKSLRTDAPKISRMLRILTKSIQPKTIATENIIILPTRWANLSSAGRCFLTGFSVSSIVDAIAINCPPREQSSAALPLHRST